ncbi:MAG: HEAT repeat domain-containing protein [Planctomycetes bacterium]|nr:HEAT repeat domain-containing protein [Planctomycetota bacterium]MCD7897001.1 HEAT repeat domain-containing protein [Planctomycetaceae bacterium]
MNATLKSIQQLIYSPDDSLRLAAIKVLGAINSREPAIHKALADLMIETDNPDVFEAALTSIEASPHEQILKQLVRVLDKTDDHQERVIDAIAKIGAKAVPSLKQQFDKVPPETQRRMVRILPRIRTHLAHSFLIDCLAHPDLQLMREAIRSLREEIGKYTPAESADLFGQLSTALKDKRIKQNDIAVSAVIIAMGILADIKAKPALLSFIVPGGAPQVRRYALISLASLPLASGQHKDVTSTLYPLLDDPDYDGLVKPAVAVLSLLPPAKDDQDILRELLENPHVGVRVFAMEKLSHLDSATNAQLIMGFLPASDQDLKEAALDALSRMPSTVNIILKAIDEAPQTLRTQDMVRILSHHRNRITPERARNRIKKMLEMIGSHDKRFELNWEALKQLKPEILQSEILKIADKAFAGSEYATAALNLGLLDKGGLLTSDLRYKLMLATLKTSEKSRSRGSRASDPALEHAARLLAENPREFKSRLLAEKILTDEEYLYLGFHFSERLNEERRFGADLLRHVTHKWPRRQSAKLARQKLQLEGHQET